MNKQEFTPEQQLDRIEEMIFKARLKLEENGFAYILWGITIAITSFLQAYLIHIEAYTISWYPYLVMPLVGLFTYFYYAKKERKDKNPIDHIYSKLWIIVAINIMLIAFGFGGYLKTNLNAIILILIGIATFISGSFLLSSVTKISGLLLNLGGFIAFALPFKNQVLLMGALGIVAVLIPGILLSIKQKKKDV